MAKIQYVGARYVPAFADPIEWDNVRQYEALTIVTHLNNSFTSKKPVPAGVDISNTEYWVNTGNYNAQLATLAERVAELEVETETLTNVVFFGDSWAVGTGAGDPGTTQRENNRFSTLVAKALGLTQYNYAVGGAGFAITDNTIRSQVATAVGNMTTDQKNKTKYVVVCGGVNDLRHMTSQPITYGDFENGIVQTLTAAASAFPNAKIYVFLGNYTVTGITPTWAEWIKTAERNIQKGRSYAVCVARHVGACIDGDVNNYISDGLHPSVLGHALVASHIVNAISCGVDSVDYVGENIALSSSTATANDPFVLVRENDNARLTPCQLTTVGTITQNTQIGSIATKHLPITNLYIPVYHGNVKVGQLAITPSGSIRIIPDADGSISDGIYFPGITYPVQSSNPHK